MTNWRHLSESEIALAYPIFGEQLDYLRIRIYQGFPFCPWLNCAISPNGHIYFPKSHYLVDFSQAMPLYQIWFIHELTHVWQWQHGFHTYLAGIILALRGAYYRHRAYQYQLQPHKTFAQYNMEQQADIIAHYFAARYLGVRQYLPQLTALQAVLTPFLQQPNSRQLLPSYF